jgi:hypothetical protein
MPCDTIQTTTVEFGKDTDPKLLAEALKVLGYHDVHGNLMARLARGEEFSGTLNLTGGNVEARVQAIKREYSKQVVISQAEKMGFQVAPMNEQEEEVRHVRV